MNIIMIDIIPPAFIYLIGAFILPIIKNRRAQQAFVLLLPVIAFVNLIHMPYGNYWVYNFLGFDLVLGKVDKLSMLFSYVFVIMSFIGMVYAIHIKEYGQHVAACLYVGSTLGVVFAGDLLTLFIFWEIMAASSVFLIWYQRTKSAMSAGFRYILVHLAGGTFLLAGIVIHATTTGSIAFVLFDIHELSTKLILIGFLVNAAVPPLHAWLSDAYPEGTVTGSVFMTAFTTKSAVYVLARSFPGVELLVWLGAIMALYGVVYAVMENDIRRLLSYHIISQVGFMVCGVGLGSELAINGAGAHAFSHILYKAILFMGAGAVIHVTGRRKSTELHGHELYKKMPVTLTLYMVGAFSISAVPLFNGFISKNMVVAAAGELNRPVIELMLHLASIGTFLSISLKLPQGIWFGSQKGSDKIPAAKEPPLNMLLAMGIGSFLCILTGIYPKLLYDLLPYQVHFHPYEAGKVVAMMQLLLLTLSAFWIYIDKLGGEAAISLDTDWFYRNFGRALLRFCNEPLNQIRLKIQTLSSQKVAFLSRLSQNPYVPLEMFWHIVQGKTLPLKDLVNQAYSPHIYRLPIGVGICMSLVFFLIYGLVYLWLV
jgi:multicomponent Na+:H+ antiporter subunit D